MFSFKRLFLSLAFTILLILALHPRVFAEEECQSLYGGGVVCIPQTPTPTGVPPAPSLPAAGVESIVIPSLVSLFAAGMVTIGYSKRKISG